MDHKLVAAAEALVAGALMLALFYLIAFLGRLIIKKDISTWPHYYTVAVVSGVALRAGLIAVLSSTPTTGGVALDKSVTNTMSPASLDAAFVAPPEESVERFPAQLVAAQAQLTQSEQAELDQAFGFFGFALISKFSEEKPEEFDAMDDSDLAAMILAKLYRFAQENGSSMTLRKYVELADYLRRDQPALWTQYLSAMAPEGA